MDQEKNYNPVEWEKRTEIASWRFFAPKKYTFGNFRELHSPSDGAVYLPVSDIVAVPITVIVKAVVVAKWLEQWSRNLEVQSSNLPGAKAFSLLLSTTECP